MGPGVGWRVVAPMALSWDGEARDCSGYKEHYYKRKPALKCGAMDGFE